MKKYRLLMCDALSPQPSPLLAPIHSMTPFCLQNKRAKEILDPSRSSNLPSTTHARSRGWEGRGTESWEFYIVNRENPHPLLAILIPAPLIQSGGDHGVF